MQNKVAFVEAVCFKKCIFHAVCNHARLHCLSHLTVSMWHCMVLAKNFMTPFEQCTGIKKKGEPQMRLYSIKAFID